METVCICPGKIETSWDVFVCKHKAGKHFVVVEDKLYVICSSGKRSVVNHLQDNTLSNNYLIFYLKRWMLKFAKFFCALVSIITLYLSNISSHTLCNENDFFIHLLTFSKVRKILFLILSFCVRCPCGPSIILI